MQIVRDIGLMMMAAVSFAWAVPSRGFEVASIKVNPEPWKVLLGFSYSGPRLTLEGYKVVDLIEEAYNLKNYQVSLPRSSARAAEYQTVYNVVGKAEEGDTPTRDEFRGMLQTLLAERFRLKFHREMREIPVFALVVGKNGDKLRETPAGTTDSGGAIGVNGRNQTMTLKRATLAVVASGIESISLLDRPVVDETGLSGYYDVKLEATPEFRISGDSQPGDVSVFTAVQETLGLRLEPRKAQVQVLVVDQVEKPAAN
jgi:uncharacterized protein (TIGR03435 family)